MQAEEVKGEDTDHINLKIRRIKTVTRSLRYFWASEVTMSGRCLSFAPVTQKMYFAGISTVVTEAL